MKTNKTKIEKITKMMNSSNYNERFKGEYHYLLFNIQKLDRLLERYKKGELDFTLTCPCELLEMQIRSMKIYFEILEKRAELEEINLTLDWED